MPAPPPTPPCDSEDELKHGSVCRPNISHPSPPSNGQGAPVPAVAHENRVAVPLKERHVNASFGADGVSRSTILLRADLGLRLGSCHEFYVSVYDERPLLSPAPPELELSSVADRPTAQRRFRYDLRLWPVDAYRKQCLMAGNQRRRAPPARECCP